MKQGQEAKSVNSWDPALNFTLEELGVVVVGVGGSCQSIRLCARVLGTSSNNGTGISQTLKVAVVQLGRTYKEGIWF